VIFNNFCSGLVVAEELWPKCGGKITLSG